MILPWDEFPRQTTADAAPGSPCVLSPGRCIGRSARSGFAVKRRIMKIADENGLKEEESGEPLFRLASRTFGPRRNGMNPAKVHCLLRGTESPRTRLSKPSQAGGRVSGNRDVNIVLREVIDNPRHPTGGRYGALPTCEPSESPRDFIPSGVGPVKAVADGLRILQVLDTLLANVSGYSSRSASLAIGAPARDESVAVTSDGQGGGATAPGMWRRLSNGKAVDGPAACSKGYGRRCVSEL